MEAKKKKKIPRNTLRSNINKINIPYTISFFYLTVGRRNNIMGDSIIDTDGYLLQVWKDEDI